MRRAPAGILIQGLGGVGKTTLAKGFLQWLDQTGGLKYPPFWFSFQEIRSAEFVFNRMDEALFGGNFSTMAMEKKIEALAAALHEHRFLIVWDNFESSAGIPGTAIHANLPDADRALLAQFLDELRGGATKAIITSRSPEDWLGPQRRFLLPLGGLDREERWEYCNAILHDLGTHINHNDKDLVELMNLLGGHPLAMRALLPRLEKMSASQVLAALQSNLASLKLDGSEDQAKLYATLAFVEQSLPEDLRPLLAPLGMHEGFVTAVFFEAMAKQIDPGLSRAKIDALMQALVAAGLLRNLGQAIYEMHPLLTTYLRSAQAGNVSDENRDRWARAFVGVMGSVADGLAPRELHEQRIPFHLHGQNFQYALADAERLGMSTHMAALTQALAVFAQNNRNFAVARRLFEHLAAHEETTGNAKDQAAAFHQLGRIAEEQRDFPAAGQWYRKALAIDEKQGNERGIAGTYHQLGRIAEEQRNFSAAEQWYRKSLTINEKIGNEHHAAMTYQQLGIIAQKQRDFATAEMWCRKSLAIKEREGNEHGAASTYGQLGIIAGLQGNFLDSGQWLIKCMLLFRRLQDSHSAAQTAENFMVFYKQAPPQDQEKLKSLWQAAGLGELPDT